MSREVYSLLCSAQATGFRNLGHSLGDVAAFMEEVELNLALANGGQQDRRGIERLRALAFQMQADSASAKEKVGQFAVNLPSFRSR